MTATNPPVARHITIGLTAVGAEALATVQAHDEVNPSDAVGRALRVYAHLLQDPAAGPLKVPAAGATAPLTDQQLVDAVAAAITADAMKPRAQRAGLVHAMLAVVQPELDRLAAELGRVRAELADAQRLSELQFQGLEREAERTSKLRAEVTAICAFADELDTWCSPEGFTAQSVAAALRECLVAAAVPSA